MPHRNRYEWSEARLHIFETLESQEKRIKILEDRERDGQKEVAVNKTTVAIFGSIAGVITTIIVDVVIKIIFG